jgi:hypothetical protein
VIGLNSALDVVWTPRAVVGGGHYIMSLDLDGDGRHEYLIGYEALDLRGTRLWQVDAIAADSYDPNRQHVDFTVVHRDRRENLLLAMAGSDKLYLVENGGHTRFAIPNIHCQGTAVGQFRDDSEFQVALYNSPDGPLVLYDPAGNEIWQRPTPRTWPRGDGHCRNQRLHRNRPILKLRGSREWIAYADGGWPWAVDGNGERAWELAPPEHSAKPDCPAWVPAEARRDDIGWSFAMCTGDIDGDGRDEAIIYDRRYLWVYPLP